MTKFGRYTHQSSGGGGEGVYNFVSLVWQLKGRLGSHGG